MKKLTSALQALSAGDEGGQLPDPANDLARALDSTTTSRPSLETLPVELQRLILSNISNLQTLSAIVHASPQFHRIYSEDRMPILRLILARTLNGILIDAVGAYRSGVDSFQKNRTKPALWSFVEELTEKYTAPAAWTTELSFDDIIHILRFHDSVIEPLTERYASWALASLPGPGEAGDGQQLLSDTERHRIQRAMYRLQIFCHLCGSLGEGRSSPDRIGENVDRLRVLLIFQPWEVEEISSIHFFAVHTYNIILRQVAWDLNERKNPRYKDVDMTDVNEDLLLICNDWTEDGYINIRSMNAVLRHGLQVLSSSLSNQSHERLVQRMRDAIVTGMGYHESRWGHDWMNEALMDVVQEDRRERWYSSRDLDQDWRKKMPFDGDCLNSPSLGWVLYWKGEYSNLVGNFVHFELRRWGFVMWDAARLTSEAKDLIEFWYMQQFGSNDPREDNYDPSVANPERGSQEWWDS